MGGTEPAICGTPTGTGTDRHTYRPARVVGGSMHTYIKMDKHSRLVMVKVKTSDIKEIKDIKDIEYIKDIFL